MEKFVYVTGGLGEEGDTNAGAAKSQRSLTMATTERFDLTNNVWEQC